MSAVHVDSFFNDLMAVASNHGADCPAVRKAIDLVATTADLAFNYPATCNHSRTRGNGSGAAFCIDCGEET